MGKKVSKYYSQGGCQWIEGKIEKKISTEEQKNKCSINKETLSNENIHKEISNPNP
jgi:hypothetical protein